MRTDLCVLAQRHAKRGAVPARTHKWTIIVLWALLALNATTVRAAPALQETAPTVRIWTVLLPLFIASFAVERAIEIFWNYLDWLLLNLRAWQPAQIKSAQYIQFKSGTSLLIGAVAGILIASYTGMRLLEALLPFAPALLEGVPPVWDVIITGVVIGAGTKPVHDLIGIITQFKNLLGSSAIHQREKASAALADGVLKLAQSDAQAMIDIPGVGPARISPPGQSMRGMGDSDDQASGAEQPTSTEGYIDTLHNRTVF
jgi:hypothetical protein